MQIELPYAHKSLWPNGRAHWGEKAKQTKLHRAWGFAAARAALPVCFKHNGEPIPVSIAIYAKPSGQLPDADNVLASCKAYLDGIADALGVNDNVFVPQPVQFVGRSKFGSIVVSI